MPDNARLYKKILRKVRPLLSKEDKQVAHVLCVEKGNSTVQNYCILIRNIPIYFVKVYEKRIKPLPKLKQLSKQHNCLVNPIFDFSIGSKRCMVLDWLDGDIISGTPSDACKVAEILKTIHSQNYSGKHNRMHILLELNRYLLYLIIHKVEFTHKQEIIKYLFKNYALCRKESSLTHMDVHRCNFITDSTGNIHLVDYENLCITDPWRDFVYACFFHYKEEHFFWETVINHYFNNNIPENFWITMKYYCYIQLLRMIICEHQKGNYEKADGLANNIWKNWNCNDSVLPKWKSIN